MWASIALIGGLHTMPRIKHGDIGKTVFDSTGNEIGTVSNVDGSTVHVEPDSDLTDRIRSRMGWDDPEMDEYTLDSNQADKITDDEIHLG